MHVCLSVCRVCVCLRGELRREGRKQQQQKKLSRPGQTLAVLQPRARRCSPSPHRTRPPCEPPGFAGSAPCSGRWALGKGLGSRPRALVAPAGSTRSAAARSTRRLLGCWWGLWCDGGERTASPHPTPAQEKSPVPFSFPAFLAFRPSEPWPGARREVLFSRQPFL